MAFRYINPGYAGFLSDATAFVTVENRIYNRQHGVALSNKAYAEIIPAGYVSTELYCKFDLYVVGDPYYGDSFVFGIARYDVLNNESWTMGICTYDGYAYIYNSSRKARTSEKLKSNALNEINFSVNIQESTASLTLNGETISSDNLSFMNYYGINSPIKAKLVMGNDCTYYLSNLILADKPISPKEQVIALPPVTTVTNMTAGANGIYVANEENQILLQSVDTSTLIENYGASSAVTGIALVGNPAYKTGTGLAGLTSLSKAGTSTIEHGTVHLSDDTSAVIFDGWATENLTIADLQNMQFGWKAGT